MLKCELYLLQANIFKIAKLSKSKPTVKLSELHLILELHFEVQEIFNDYSIYVYK